MTCRFKSFNPRVITSMLRPFAAACLVAVASLGWTGWAAAAACSSTNYDLNTQAEVDALGATGCDSVSGYLYIKNSTDITNLDGLANITSVGSSMLIDTNAALPNLDGLANLKTVGGFLYISSNNVLTNIDGLANLASEGTLGIFGNDALTNLNGLANITRVQDLLLSGNAALTNLDGLVELTIVDGTLQVYEVAGLIDLDGLSNLISVGVLNISNNAALTNLDGLSKLTSVGTLALIDNDALLNIDGLANIISVGGDLTIRYNDNLTEINSLAKLTTVAERLYIGENEALTNIDGLANLASVGGLSLFANNALTNINGLANITSVGGDLSISSNDLLTNLDSLANLTSVEGYLSLGSNDTLTNLDGLANLKSVGGFLNISGSEALTNLDGLASLTRAGEYLRILGNDALTNLDGLASLASVGSYLEIDRNYNASCEGVAQLLGWPNGPPDDTVTGDIAIGDNGPGCDSIAEILASVSGPTKPMITSASAIGGGGISVQFSPSTAPDAPFPVTGYEAACTGSSADLSEAPAAALLDNTPVTRILTISGYDPVSVLSDIEVDIDITHSDPTDLYITLTTPQGTELVLWNQGNSGGEDIAGTFPTTLTPIDAISSVGRQAMDGDWVLRVEDVDVGPLVREGVLNAWGLRISETVTTAGSGSPITVNGVTRGRDYSCIAAPVTGLGAVPASDAVTVNVPLELPATPSVTSTDYEDGTIRLTVSVADNGGADITEYAATCTDGTSTFTGTSSTPTIEVTGLTNGTAYTCNASATNAVGSSGASVATESITPEPLPAGLPIWLLYEATK